MKTFVLAGIISLSSLTAVVAKSSRVRPDTTLPKSTNQQPVRAILPGYQLDTGFSGLATPDPAVYKAVPKWLQTKVGGKPIYVVDGQVATASQLKGLKASAVESVNMINGKRAVALYGSVAHEGVVAITTKAAWQPMKK